VGAEAVLAASASRNEGVNVLFKSGYQNGLPPQFGGALVEGEDVEPCDSVRLIFFNRNGLSHQSVGLASVAAQ
jgi:hypothetical protein